jgi:hypothetical protein
LRFVSSANTRFGHAVANEQDFRNLRSEHRVPGRRRSLALDSEAGRRELILVDAPEEFNAGNGSCGRCKVLEAEQSLCGQDAGRAPPIISTRSL